METRPPAFLYGTAWKEDQTQAWVALALRTGFRGIDTANQRKHYHEAGVGAGIAEVIKEGLLTRDDLFLQTKFTFIDGQDQRLPYDPKAPIAVQVRQSFDSSLQHLGTRYLDSLVLHGPSQRSGLGPEDWEAWGAMEALFDAGLTRAIGISNVSAAQLQLLLSKARVAPAFVQNRCYAIRGWDREVRALCDKHQARYQGFSLLTANVDVLQGSPVRSAAARLRCTPEQVVLCFSIQVGMLPLTGTTDPEHMRADLEAAALVLTQAEMDAIAKSH